MLSLLVGNSVNQILSKVGLSICSDAASSTHVAYLIDNYTNVTCGALKGEIAISLAMTSGLIMVSAGIACVCMYVCVCVCVSVCARGVCACVYVCVRACVYVCAV